MPLSGYSEVVRLRQWPGSVGQAREDSLIAIDSLSRDMAVSRVRLRIREHTFVDYLTLANVDGVFGIVAETWHEI